MTHFALGRFLLGSVLSLAVVGAVLGTAFAVAKARGLHRVVDVAWGSGFAAVAVVSYASSLGQGSGLRRALLLALTVVWGLRLATHIYLRGRGEGEDPRYAELISRARGDVSAYLVRKVYLPQGISMWFVSLAVQVGMYARGGLRPLLYAGVVLWVVGFAFEAFGDWQLTRFRRDPASRGKVLDTGLWRYTRHPNYFGDACVWWGLFLLTASAWPGVLTVLSPAVMTFFLARGTGKPLLEKGMARTRPQYADYVARTSGFFPLPPKRRAVRT